MDQQDQARHVQGELREKVCEYVRDVMESIRRGKTFLLHPGFQIVEALIAFQSVSDSLFLESIYHDDPDDFVVAHHVNVAIFAVKMAKHLGWNRNRQLEIGTAALLHGVGIALVADKLPSKKGELDEDELLTIRQYLNYTYDILSMFKDDHAYLAECSLHVGQLRGRSGYAFGAASNSISEYAQIIGLLDMYEALIHTRPYRKKKSHVAAVMEIARSGKNVFQTSHIRAMLDIFSGFPINSYIRLNTGAIGRIIESYPAQPLRPKVIIIFNARNKRLSTKRIVDLQENSSLHIIDSVSEEELSLMLEG